MHIYCDESGDLGWIFHKPFGNGGSSRYLSIAFLVTPKSLSKLPKRIVRDIYDMKKLPTTIKLKGIDLTHDDKMVFAKKVIKLLKKNPELEVFAITVKKINVEEHIRHDPNKLYNYMIGLILSDKIKDFPEVTLIPDKRSIKVKSGNRLVDYLQIKLWFELNAQTNIQFWPQESHQNLNLLFVDYIVNIVWNHYENNETSIYKMIKNKIESRCLFFN